MLELGCKTRFFHTEILKYLKVNLFLSSYNMWRIYQSFIQVD